METLLAADFSAAAPDFSGWDREQERALMVERQIAQRGVSDERVLTAMRRVPRHAFVPEGNRRFAYHDTPLPIGHQQTISQPYMVAFMTEQLNLAPKSRVLEIGAGCGYQTAILGLLAKEVIAVEIVAPLARQTAGRLRGLGFGNVTLLLGDGSSGHAPGAPYDAILIAAATTNNVDSLAGQLSPEGKMIAPIGPENDTQQLTLIERNKNGALIQHSMMPVRFVPLVHGL